MSRAPVSVVIPCYRCVGTIRRAVETVARQTALPEEVILVDDASGDGTLALLESLADEYGRAWIRVIAQRVNQGAADARNAGWEAATQPYIAFLDADDAWHPRKIAIQHAFMAAHPEVGLCAHRHEIVARLPETPADIGPLTAQPVSKLSLLLSNNFFAPTMMMLRRDLPYRYRAGRRYVDDHLLWLQILLGGTPFVRLSAKLAYTFKAPYGESGLSARMWEMEKAELENYWILHREGRLRVPTALGLSAYSLAKYLRRLLRLSLMRPRQRA